MHDEIQPLTVGVRADTAGFAREVEQMRASLEGGLGQGADKAGRMIEASLVRAATGGKLGFDTLRTAALAALAEVEASAVKLGLNALFGSLGSATGGRQGGAGPIGGGADGGGLGGLLGRLLGGALGLPGRATGGPVSPGSAYLVGERGPELFVPTSSGGVAALDRPGGDGSGRDVRIAITVNAATDAPAALRQSSRQVARAVKAALDG